MKKKKKKNALIICHNGKQFWTTQTQFWQWTRERTVIKIADNPLTGKFTDENVEYTVVISKTVLNLTCPNHLREALEIRRIALR